MINYIEYFVAFKFEVYIIIYSDKIHMSVGIDKIHPLLAASVASRAGKEIIGSRISLVKKRNQIIFHCSFLIHIESKVSVHGF